MPRAEFQILAEQSAIERQYREEQEAIAADKFERRMLELLECGAKDRAMALRWIHEAEESNGDNEYLCFLLGLPYRYFN